MSTSTYVHFPWCLQKCPYCDFASATIRRPDVPHIEYADAVLRELELRAGRIGAGPLESVFFGGGTPSLWEPRELGRVLTAIRGAFGSQSDDVEITVECNPSSLDQRRAAELREAGVNRLSIGVQSLDAKRLRFLGRLHDGPGALAAVRGALAEMPRVSADLMFGMPEQTPEDFLAELSQLLELGLTHVSVYALTVEPQTQFGELHRKGKLQLAKEDAYADTFLACEAKLAEHGFEHYEVSNYAKPGETSRHNQHYWRGGDYLGLGCAAVGCIDKRRTRNQAQPAKYFAAVESVAGGVSATRTSGARVGDRAAQGGEDRTVAVNASRAALVRNALDAPALEQESEQLDAQAIIREGLMLGLRTSEGVDLRALEQRAGVDPRKGRERELAKLLEQKRLSLENDRLRVPHESWLHLDGIVTDLF